MASCTSVRRRPLANANIRIDVLSVVFETSSRVATDSPCDSLSPLNPDFSDNDRNDKKPYRKQDTSKPDAGSHAVHVQTKQEPHFTSPPAQESNINAEATPSQSTTQACSPRSPSLCLSRDNRPAGLRLKNSNGLTTITSTNLRQRIFDGQNDVCDSRSQEARPKHKSSGRRPKTPAPPPPQMGNKPSSLNGSPTPAADDASLSSVVHNPARVWRKSSTNLFKRFDSKSPLPRPLTATSIIVTASGGAESPESPVDPFIDPAHAARDSIIMLPSASETTMTDELASRPLSASTTVKEARGCKSYTDFGVMTVSEAEKRPASVLLNPRSTLSPTLPTPSPLPEDSPHKYGLKDHMDTPEKMLEPPEDLNVQKARRRSSGLEIFNVNRHDLLPTYVHITD
ncbi:hypothetical protein LTR78_004841 [Recurvomyces mirabilis]|uniref:Uncharacterized protein n=1 Tax=Recurvomyces mirabilis TaxID=574656 RepID=A0AAE0WPC2_9PEZI|nr:hypothetical protein LTR78_004841 [Recurvomyces mirabilis]KAK5158011.1 hypothetical protein LTS14_003934 [Recurvomyces mirabilis]